MKRIKKLIGILLFVLTFGLASTITIPQIGTCVDVQAATVSLNKRSTSVYIGKTTQLKVKNYTGKIRWSSSNTSIATVSSTGKVKGKKAGTVTISARAGKKTLKCKVTVRSVISVSPKTLYMDGVDDETITVTLKKSCGLRYSISNPDIVSCSWDDDWYKNGKVTYLYVTAEKTGTTYITISNKYSSEKAKIKVVVDIDSDNGDDNDNNQDAFTELKNYILIYGSPNNKGDNLIDKDMYDNENNYWKWVVIYESGTKQLHFMVSRLESGSNQMFGEIWLDSNLNAYVKYEYSIFDNEGYVDAIASINPDTYTKHTKLRYNIIENTLFLDSSVPSVADSCLVAGFSGWKIILQEAGISFRDLGFLSLVIN